MLMPGKVSAQFKTLQQSRFLLAALGGLVLASSTPRAWSETLVPMPGITEFRELSLSRNGSQLAYVTTTLNGDKTNTTDELRVVATQAPSEATVIATGALIHNVYWNSAGTILYFMDGRYPRTIMRMNLSGHRELLNFDFPIQEFVAAPSHDEIAALLVPPGPAVPRSHADGQPVSYAVTPSTSSLSFVDQQWSTGPARTQLWLTGPNTRPRRIALEYPGVNIGSAELSDLDWSADSEIRLILRNTPDQPGPTKLLHVGIGSLREGARQVDEAIPGTTIVTPLLKGTSGVLLWQNSSHGQRRRALTLLSRDQQSSQDFSIRPAPLDIDGAWMVGRDIWVQTESSKGGALLRIDSTTGLQQIKIEPATGSLSKCDLHANTALCVWENLWTAPEVVRVNLLTGELSPLTHFNTGRRLDGEIRFTQFQVTNAYGRKSIGYLALPTSYPGVDLPICIILYNFRETFSARAQWIRNYPVAELVGRGVGVLLLNFAHEDQETLDDASALVQARREALLLSPLSTVYEAVNVVTKRGLRPRRLGLMGWSWGGFIAAHVSARPGPFSAVSIGEAATWGPAAYSTGPSYFRDILDRMIGGPPDAVHYMDYLATTPGLRGESPLVPTLIEAGGHNVASLEYFTMFARNNPKVRAFIYPAVDHHFTSPEREELSMRRNLLWMRAYLSDYVATETDRRDADIGYSLPGR